MASIYADWPIDKLMSTSALAEESPEAIENARNGKIFLWVKASACSPHEIYWLSWLNGSGVNITSDYAKASSLVSKDLGWQPMTRFGPNTGWGTWLTVSEFEGWLGEAFELERYEHLRDILARVKEFVSLYQ